MIIDYKGKGAEFIFKNLVDEGVNVTDLADLYRKTGATGATGVPRYITIEGNQIIGASDTYPAPVTSTEPASANTLNLTGITAAESTPMPDNSTQGGSENSS